MLHGTTILLVISGGIAAYKSLDVIRRMREHGAEVRCVLTESATHLVAPLAVAALSEARVHTELFSLTDESEMSHIRLVREADLVLVAPATADLLAKMAVGIADDLASTLLLACDRPIVVAPSMNVVMWEHPATQGNLDLLQRRGVHRVGPTSGDLACGETGTGRMADPDDIVAAVEAILKRSSPLAGRRALVTSGPTHERIDPVRYLGNRSSGKQGHAIAAVLAAAGTTTVLVSGPTSLADPPGVEVVHVESAVEMLSACEAALPVDVAVCAAAVADWRVTEPAMAKLKKSAGHPPVLQLEENPDVLASLAKRARHRPTLVVGFAAETENVLANARAKLTRKGCDWIVANAVGGRLAVFGEEHNTVHLITAQGCESWPTLTKRQVAERLVERIVDRFRA